MLQLGQLIGFTKRRRGPIRIGNYGSSTGFNTSASSRTVTGIDFGAEAPDRHVITLIAARDDAATYTVSSTSAGGVGSTILIDTGGAAARSCAIAIAKVPTGTTGQSIVVNWSEAIAAGQEIAWAVVYGNLGLEAISTGSGSGITTETVSVTGQKARAGGVALWCMFGYDGNAGGITFGMSPDLIEGSLIEITDQTASGGAFGAGIAIIGHDQDDVTLTGDQFHATPFHTMACAMLEAA